MAYFIYKIFPGGKLEPVTEFTAFKDARDQARSMRAGMGSSEEYRVKVLFAPNCEEAERLLSEKREPPPLGEED